MENCCTPSLSVSLSIPLFLYLPHPCFPHLPPPTIHLSTIPSIPFPSFVPSPLQNSAREVWGSIVIFLSGSGQSPATK